MRVLIVEDDPIQGVALRGLFNQCGEPIEVEFVETLAEADLRYKDCDLVIMDLELPDANKLQSLDWLVKCGLPSVVCSGYLDQETIVRAVEAGAFCAVVKGSVSEQIVASVQFTLAQEESRLSLQEQRVQICRKLADKLKSCLKPFGQSTTDLLKGVKT